MSKRQKTKPYDWSDFQFDQSAPDFEQVRRVDLEDSETPAALLAQTRPPEGFADMNCDTEIVAAGRNYDGTPLYLRQDNTLAARVVSKQLRSLDMRRLPVRGGVVVSLRIDGVERLRSPVMSEEQADQLEAIHRVTLHAYAAANDQAG
jgi:hypothetical protein